MSEYLDNFWVSVAACWPIIACGTLIVTALIVADWRRRKVNERDHH